MALSSASHDTIRCDWAARLDCDPAALETGGVILTERPGRTVRLLRRGDATVVAAPAGVREALEVHRGFLEEQPVREAGDGVREALSENTTAVAEVHGPAALSYVDAEAFSPASSEARLLDAEDESAFDALRARISDEEWGRASPTFRPGRTAGLCREGQLVAIATLTEPPLSDVGVVVDPAWREQGIGRGVVSRLISAELEQEPGAVVRYRTPAEASASLALAASLGFERWACELVVVLGRAQTGAP